MVPEEVRTAAYTLMQRHLTEPFADDEERRLVLRQADDACELLAAWLDAQPAAPEPDWTNAPARWLTGAVADWHTINADGCGRWHWYEPYVAKREWLSVIFSDEVCDDGRIVRYDLPIGVDWRTTLRRRPEEVQP